MSEKKSRRKKPKPVDDDELIPCPLGCDHPGLRKLSGVQGHLRFAGIHKLTTEEIRHVIASMGVDHGLAPVRKVRTVKMENFPKIMAETTHEREDVSTGRVIAFRGKLRQYSIRLGQAEGTNKFDLIPQKEFLKYAQEQLAKDRIAVSEFVLLRDAFEDEHGPVIDGLLGSTETGGAGKTGDFLDRAEEDLEREFRLRRLNRMNHEEMVKDQELARPMTSSNQLQDLLVAILPPLLNNDNGPLTKTILETMLETVVEMKLKMAELQAENRMIIDILLKMRDGS